MIKIIIIDGIPCIELSERIMIVKKNEAAIKAVPNAYGFTDIQELKEKSTRAKLMEELKEKFKEK